MSVKKGFRTLEFKINFLFLHMLNPYWVQTSTDRITGVPITLLYGLRANTPSLLVVDQREQYGYNYDYDYNLSTVSGNLTIFPDDHEIRVQTDGTPLPTVRVLQLVLFLSNSRSKRLDVHNLHVNQIGQWVTHDITLLIPDSDAGK